MGIAQLIEVTCEGPRCKRGANETPKKISWDTERSKTDPLAVPDDAWRLRTVILFNDERHVFCCVRCSHDWDLANPEPLKSPRELAAQQAAEREVQQRQLAEEKKRREAEAKSQTSPGAFAEVPQIETPKLEG